MLNLNVETSSVLRFEMTLDLEDSWSSTGRCEF